MASESSGSNKANLMNKFQASKLNKVLQELAADEIKPFPSSENPEEENKENAKIETNKEDPGIVLNYLQMKIYLIRQK